MIQVKKEARVEVVVRRDIIRKEIWIIMKKMMSIIIMKTKKNITMEEKAEVVLRRERNMMLEVEKGKSTEKVKTIWFYLSDVIYNSLSITQCAEKTAEEKSKRAGFTCQE
mmetsp:Transcript_20738/g.31387  ORF Transcript_20738/g.31387 Transcript_20738/m.31387 type:complete len:110 (-) Transcript_20738:20-349(-)